MVALHDTPGFVDDLRHLVVVLDSLDLSTADPVVMARRDQLARNLRSYLIPRALDPDRAPVVVFAGPTGSGKSTLINSLCGVPLSPSGPVRPTTTGPVVFAGEAESEVLGTIGGVECHVVTGRSPILRSLVLVDTPDIDSTSTAHRTDAENLIDHADVVVSVTSALRYADHVPWEVLRRATSRGTPVIHVLNRIGYESSGAVADLRRLLAEADLDTDLIRVPEHHLSEQDQFVPSVSVAGLRRRLVQLAQARSERQQETYMRVWNTTITQGRILRAELSDLVERLDRAHRGTLQHAWTIKNLIDYPSVSVLDVDAPSATGRSIRHWRRANEPTHEVYEEWLQVTTARLGSSLQAALRADIGSGRLTTAEVVNVRSDTAQQVRTWLGEVETLAPLGGRLGAQLIVAAALGDRHDEAMGVVLGDWALPVARARWSLDQLLDLLLTAVAERHLETGGPSIGPAHVVGLEEALNAANVGFQFADA